MNNKTPLTENEITALKTCLNYDEREEQLSDNMSNGGAREFMEALGWNAQQVGGLISSLTEKGMGYMDNEGVNRQTVDIFWLTEEGVNAIFDVIDGEGPEVVDPPVITVDLKQTEIFSSSARDRIFSSSDEVHASHLRTSVYKRLPNGDGSDGFIAEFADHDTAIAVCQSMGWRIASNRRVSRVVRRKS